MSKVDLTNAYVTKNGRKVKLYYIHEELGNYPVVGAVYSEGEWFLEKWSKKGINENAPSDEMDLIPVKEKLTGYINIYPSHVFSSKREADASADDQRIACLYIEFEKKQGL